MIISSVKKRRNDVEIVFDDKSKIIVDYRVVYDNGLRKHDEITKEFCEDLKSQSEKLKIKDSAFRLLGRRQHSTYELKQKLLRREFTKEQIAVITGQMQENGYLDDLKFAEAYTAERIAKRKIGINKIKAELIKKGIESKIIEAVLSTFDVSLSEETALSLVIKKLEAIKKKETDVRKIKQKLASFLFTKGFDTEIIRKTIDKLELNDNEFEDL